MNKLSRLSRLTTTVALAMVAFVMLFSASADYAIYVWRESGGTATGPWYQYVGTATSSMGGNIGVNSLGGILLDNRTADGAPTTIYYNPPPPPAGRCQPWPCVLLE